MTYSLRGHQGLSALADPAWGRTVPAQQLRPSTRFVSATSTRDDSAAPDGAFPTGVLVTRDDGGLGRRDGSRREIVSSAFHPPGGPLPIGHQRGASPAVYLTSADYSSPGARSRRSTAKDTLLWRYAPTGADALNHPSIAKALPNGDIVATDDHNHRVIVVDPHTNRIVWQYGHPRNRRPEHSDTSTAPTDLDLAPPHSNCTATCETAPSRTDRVVVFGFGSGSGKMDTRACLCSVRSLVGSFSSSSW